MKYGTLVDQRVRRDHRHVSQSVKASRATLISFERLFLSLTVVVVLFNTSVVRVLFLSLWPLLGSASRPSLCVSHVAPAMIVIYVGWVGYVCVVFFNPFRTRFLFVLNLI